MRLGDFCISFHAPFDIQPGDAIRINVDTDEVQIVRRRRWFRPWRRSITCA